MAYLLFAFASVGCKSYLIQYLRANFRYFLSCLRLSLKQCLHYISLLFRNEQYVYTVETHLKYIYIYFNYTSMEFLLALIFPCHNTICKLSQKYNVLVHVEVPLPGPDVLAENYIGNVLIFTQC